MTRITDKDLEAVAFRINSILKQPTESYTQRDGKHRANVGNYHISHAYGGVSLHRMHNEGGGVADVFGCGHVTKRELYGRMQAFIRGVEVCPCEK